MSCDIKMTRHEFHNNDAVFSTGEKIAGIAHCIGVKGAVPKIKWNADSLVRKFLKRISE